MTWHEEKVLVNIYDDMDELITQVEIRKDQYAMIVAEACRNGITAEEQFLKFLHEYIEHIENE